MPDKPRKTRRANARKKGLSIPAHHYAYRSGKNCEKHGAVKTYYCATCKSFWRPYCEEKHP